MTYATPRNTPGSCAFIRIKNTNDAFVRSHFERLVPLHTFTEVKAAKEAEAARIAAERLAAERAEIERKRKLAEEEEEQIQKTA